MVYPAFGYQPETSFQAGAFAVGILQSKDTSQIAYLRQSTFSPYFIYTTQNQLLSALDLDYFFKSGTNLNTTLRLFNFPDRFFGIGNIATPDLAEDYTHKFAQLEGQLLLPKSSTFFYGLGIDMQTSTIANNKGSVLTPNTKGATGGRQLAGGPAARYDSRDNSIYPTKGFLINFSCLMSYIGDFSYTSIALDIRRYLSVGNDKNVLAFQLRNQFIIGEDVPFYKLPRLGGGGRLRGIENASLYRDRQAVFSQVEFRKHLFWRVGAVAFAGLGGISEAPSQLDASELKYVSGLGLRYQVIPAQRMNVRFDYGFALGGQSAFYLSVREAF